MKSKRILQLLTLPLLLALISVAAKIPAGTMIPVRFNTELSSETAKVGNTFEGSVAQAVTAGSATIPAGAAVRGKVIAVKPSGRLETPGELTLQVTSVEGKAVTSAPVALKGKSHTKSNAVKIGGGAAAGAIIGGLAGGGKGAAIGAGAGGAAGTGVAAATGKQPALVKPEEVIEFTIQ